MAEFLPHTTYFSEHFTEKLQAYFDSRTIYVQTLAGDASSRKYYLLHNQNQVQNYLACVSPQETNNNQDFYRIQRAWQKEAIPVPEIYEFFPDSGEFLLQYLEGQDFVESLSTQPRIRPQDYTGIFYSYSKALELLARIHELHLGYEAREIISHYPEYDEQTIVSEMQLFADWFIPEFGDSELAHSYYQLSLAITQDFLHTPYTVLHRDFHSRNLKWQADRLFVLDFQDAIRGPVTYDLVSLIYDCYVELPVLMKYQIFIQAYSQYLHQYYKSQELAYKDFSLVAMQRLLKVAGIFCRLAFRDSKIRYLESLPLCLRHLLDASAECPLSREFHARLQGKIEEIMGRIEAVRVSGLG